MFRWRKWDGSPHWVHECVYLGSDEWGDWFGQLAGWRSARPGRDFAVEAPNVTLVPPSGDFAAPSTPRPDRTRIYIDIAWDLRWEDGEPTGIDMDLDVVDTREGRGIFIDDRDEWDEHRVAYGYPLDLVDAARGARARPRAAGHRAAMRPSTTPTPRCLARRARDLTGPIDPRA